MAWEEEQPQKDRQTAGQPFWPHTKGNRRIFASTTLVAIASGSWPAALVPSIGHRAVITFENRMTVVTVGPVVNLARRTSGADRTNDCRPRQEC